MKKAFQGKHSDLTDLIIKAFYLVYNELGYGFSEKIYERAMELVLAEMGLVVEKEKSNPGHKNKNPLNPKNPCPNNLK